MTSDASRPLFLEELESVLGAAASDPDLMARADAWVARHAPSTALGTVMRAQVGVLRAALQQGDDPKATRLAAAGLAYLARPVAVRAEPLEWLEVRARSFVLAAVARELSGGAEPRVGPLSPEDRERTEAALQALGSGDPGQDAALLDSVRGFCASPPIPADSVFACRLLRNAEVLVAVLADPLAAEDARSTARAALEYLVLEEDGIDDRLGVVGLVDDAWVLDEAVAAIDPWRRAWVQALEAAQSLGEGDSIAVDGQAFPRDAVMDAALLSEPWLPAGPLRSALLVPVGRGVPAALAIAVARRPEAGAVVVLVSPEASPLPGVRVVGTLDAAAQAAEQLGPEAVILVDPRLVDGSAGALSLPVVETTLPAASDRDLVALYAREATSIPRTTDAEEAALGRQKAQARAAMAAALQALGARAEAHLPSGADPEALTDEDFTAVAAGLEPEALVADRAGADPELVDAWRTLRTGLRQIERTVDVLTRGNLRLVIWAARRMSRQDGQLLDRVQEGNIALMRAARLHDPDKGRFGPYALLWIRQAIRSWRDGQSRTIRIPGSALRVIRKVDRARRDLTAQLGHEPAPADVARHLELEVAEVEAAMTTRSRLIAGCLPLDAPTRAGEGTSLGERVPDPKVVSADATIALKEVAAQAQRLVETLPDREARVLRLRFGIGDDRRHTYTEIGAALGIHEGRARQLEHRALARLRRQTREERSG